MPKEFKTELLKAVGQARGVLEDLQRIGFEEVCRQQSNTGVSLHSDGDSRQIIESLVDVSVDLGNCQRCALSENRTKIVFGVGNPDADIVFIGEGPGGEDDLQGVPFVDEAGQLLGRIITAMGLKREDVYICNIVKCRPSDNRGPHVDEVASCVPFLTRQLDAIRPQVIIALGEFATQTLTQSDISIAKARGHWQQYRNIPLMPTFHPAYLLQKPVYKREVWNDMKAVLKKLL